jgi:hypothetical protein
MFSKLEAEGRMMGLAKLSLSGRACESDEKPTEMRIANRGRYLVFTMGGVEAEVLDGDYYNAEPRNPQSITCQVAAGRLR